MSRVVIVKGDYSELEAVFSRIFSYLGADSLRNAKQIAIKINLCDFRQPESGAITHPAFLDAFLGWITSQLNHSVIFVVESDATSARPDLAVRWLGIDQIIKKHGAKWVNLSKDTWSRKQIRGLTFHSMKVPDTIAQSDLLISMAKMKTHSLTKISCSLKNQYGCIMYPKKIVFHDALDEAIVDSCTAMPPQIAIVDGITAMGGPKGPVDGVPIDAGLVVAGMDPVAVDAACARIMGLNPHRIGHLKKAEAAGLGRMEFEVVGDGIPTELPDFETNELYRRVIQFTSMFRRRSLRRA